MLNKLRFRSKLMLFPALASVAFIVILAMAPFFAQRNEAAVERIRSGYLPALQARQSLVGRLDQIQRTLQDAVAVENLDALKEADRHQKKAVADLKTLERLRITDQNEIRKFKTQFLEYYEVARKTSASMIRGDMTDQTLAMLREMSERYKALEATLEKETAADAKSIDRAFQAAVAANRSSMYSYMGAAVIALVLMVLLAVRMTRTTMSQIDLVSQGFERMAGGDFSKPVELVVEDELGELGRQLNQVAAFVNQLASRIMDTAAEINSAANELSTAALVHQKGASEQSSAVSEIRRTIESTVNSADDVTASAETSLRNAEDTQEKNVVIANGIQALSAHTDRIGEILENIKDIANKSELLALNAALEGTKAGEAGRGFSLVASQMQRLAENVIGAVRDIRRLTSDIHTATATAVAATAQGTELAKITTDSARQIRLVMQQHRSSTALVSQAMDDIVDVAHRSAAHSEQVKTASTDLAGLSERLVAMISSISVDRGGAKGQ